VLDLASGISEDPNDDPIPGPHKCFTVCIKCGHVMMFDDDLRLRDLTEAEQIEIAADKRLITIQQARSDVLRDRAYSEDFVREMVKYKKKSMPPDWRINLVVDKVLAAVPKPPRQAR